jgi:hypothetical protein
MIPTSLIEQALRLPVSAIEYHLSKELTALLAGKGLLETSWWSFDLDDFALHRQCTVAPLLEPHAVLHRRPGDPREDLAIGLREVRWKEEVLQVLDVQWYTACGREHRHWVIARDQATADAFFEAVCGFCVDAHEEVYVFEEGDWEKSSELYQAIQGTTLEGLILAPGLKEELLRDASTFFASEETYRAYRIPWRRGLLLTGPPGNGKTHAIKGLVNALGKSCLYVRSFTCEGLSDQRNIREVFRRARSSAPCLLILEDLDSLITDENRSFFLNELDGFAQNQGILVLATTNHPERLDPAIVERPSRFDRKYSFDLPAPPERLAYLRRWSGDLHPELRPSGATLEQAAELTEGFSFAYLKEALVSSTVRWAQDRPPGGMDPLLIDTLALLRKQVHAAPGG